MNSCILYMLWFYCKNLIFFTFNNFLDCDHYNCRNLLWICEKCNVLKWGKSQIYLTSLYLMLKIQNCSHCNYTSYSSLCYTQNSWRMNAGVLQRSSCFPRAASWWSAALQFSRKIYLKLLSMMVFNVGVVVTLPSTYFTSNNVSIILLKDFKFGCDIYFLNLDNSCMDDEIH